MFTGEFEDAQEIFGEGGQLLYRVIQYSKSASEFKENEDYLAFAVGESNQRVTRGNLLVLADGMSGGKSGRVASELLVRQLIEGYQQLPSTFSIEQALARSLAAVNKSLYWLSRRDPDLDGMAAVFCAVALRGWECFVCFAGDVRCYRWRHQQLHLLTTDHVMKIGGGHFISRAAGLDEALQAEVVQVDVEDHDLLLLLSDGCYKYLAGTELREILLSTPSAMETARQLVDLARANGSSDDASVGIIELAQLPRKSLRFFEDTIFSVPVGHVPALGALIDDYKIQKKLHDGYYSALFLASDQKKDGELKVLKFPKSTAQGDENVRRSFAKENWVASIVSSPWLASSGADNRSISQVYTVFPYYRGQTLSGRIRQGIVSWSEGLDIARMVAHGLYELHRLHIFHRDVKPDNIMLLDDGGVILLDYGFARIPGALDPAPKEAPGTLAYMSPEMFRGGLGDSRSDVYALGVTLYRMFSQDKSPIDTHGYRSLRRFRGDCPGWLDRILAKMIETDPNARYSDTLEVLYDMDNMEKLSQLESSRNSEPRWPIREVLVLRILVLLLVLIILVLMELH
ncbi:bifunctional protein-serine/threonine kinase/phosphatase [Acidithiobacillus albertensis]|uniref:bifunctional protein-serine/threonine kinase/phosphatase n=1 Tax=Acidithiobacillus albertensis TaxID=119978 RepID=UPI00094B15AC|nr:bifunctional protein-serine/threonine kinase/phosphatase [Acidithiobacillus albertensis]